MTYYQDGHIRDKIKVVLDLSNYVTKKELHDATGVHTSSLAAKRDFANLKAEVGKCRQFNTTQIIKVWRKEIADADKKYLKLVL